MKNSLTERRALFLLLFTLITLATPSCGHRAKNLDRASAQQLIEADEKFKQPFGVTLNVEDDWEVRPQSADETEQDAGRRALERYLSEKLGMAVLQSLGDVEVKATLVKRFEVKGHGLLTTVDPWVFKIEPALTEKGRAVVKSQSGKDDQTIWFGHREVVEVSGIREKDGQAAADFTWKVMATEAGKAFDRTSDTFKSLPAELREEMTRARGMGPFASAATQDWSLTNKAVANFQKYDDGWRLTGISSGLF